MKLSLNQARYYEERYKWSSGVTDLPLDSLIEKIGSQLGAIDQVIELGQKYKGIVIVKVVDCHKHENADKLNVCLVEDNQAIKDVNRDSNGLVEVVCGAPNVRAGMLAAWLPPGTTVPETADKDPFVIEAREIRGVISNGMLASKRELAISDDHAGILEIEDDLKPGTYFDEAYHLRGETILDIENKMFTHRPDCFGLIGLARELAGIQGKQFTSPAWFSPAAGQLATSGDELKLSVNNELGQLVPRFSAVTISSVKVKPSPLWLQLSLTRLGLRPINNIVDLTNYYMLLTGQPLHAYDYDKLKRLSAGDPSLVIRNPKPGEKLKLLNGKTIEPQADAIMIATDKELIGVGGVMGGEASEVDDDSQNIVLECANFDMYSVRRTAMANGLFTDAVTRFTKGQSPLQNLAVLAKAAQDIVDLSGGHVASQIIDDNHVDEVVLQRHSLYSPVSLSVDFINDRLGSDLTAEKIKILLGNVEFKVSVEGDELSVTPPFWRTDIELREDVVEEVGRLYGYERLPLTVPKRDLTPATIDAKLRLKSNIRAKLSRLGANELLTYSFVDGELLDKVSQDKDKAFKVANALRPELQYYRLSLLPSLLEKVHPNLKAGYQRFALFELGKSHSQDALDDDGLPIESQACALVVAADDKLKLGGSAYYLAKSYLDQLFNQDLEFSSLDQATTSPIQASSFDPNRSAAVKTKAGQPVGFVGEFKPSVCQKLKLPSYSAGFEVALDDLLQDVNTKAYRPLSRFPKVTQDISLKVGSSVSYQSLAEAFQAAVDELKPDRTYVQLEPLGIYQAAADQEHKSVTLRLIIVSYDRTLTDKEVNHLLEQAASSLNQSLGAERI